MFLFLWNEKPCQQMQKCGVFIRFFLLLQVIIMCVDDLALHIQNVRSYKNIKKTIF